MGSTAEAVMAIPAAKATRAGYAAEGQSAMEQKAMSEISTSQDVVDRGQALYQQLASLNSSFSGSGLSGAGASKENFDRVEKRFADSDITSRKVMGMAEGRRYTLSAFSSKMGGRAAKYNMYGKIAKAGGDSYRAGKIS